MSRSGCKNGIAVSATTNVHLTLIIMCSIIVADKVHIGSGWTAISCIISGKSGREKLACQLLDKWFLLSEPVSSLRKARKRKPGERARR